MGCSLSKQEFKPTLPVEGWVPSSLPRELSVIGKPLNRRDAREKVNGQAKYSTDMIIPGMLYAKALRCPHAHARIRKIDTSKAEALPGVKAIISMNNCKEWMTYWYMIPQPAFPEEIAYSGQDVAVVAAIDIEAAERAIQLIEVDYEPLPAVFDPLEARKSNAPVVPILDVNVNATRSGNVHSSDVFQRGDISRGFKEADVVVEDNYKLPGQFHADIQTRCCVTNWDGEKLTVYESSQGVWNVKLQLAKSLDLPVDNVRVVVNYMGGGFGSKAGAQRYVHYASKLAIITGLPVRFELNRRDEFVSHPRRYGAHVNLKVGAKKDGTICAVQCKCILDLGAGSLYGGGISDMILHHIGEAYKCPNMHVEVTGVYTNTVPTGPQRGVLNPVGVFCMESSIDDLASKLNIDPVLLRLKNYSQYSSEQKKRPYSSKNLDKCIYQVTKEIGWSQRDEIARLNLGKTKRRGIGMSSYVLARTGYPPYNAKAQLAIRNDGSIELKTGVVEIGSGQITVLSMIAAEELGVSLDDVKILWGDTEGSLYSPSSHASRITTEMGPAVLQAAALAREKLFQLVSRKFGLKSDELLSVNGKIYVKSNPSLSISFKEACSLIPPDEEIFTTGSRGYNSEMEVYRQFGAQAAEVEVDLETGEIKIVKIVSAYDIGRALNPKLVQSQFYGAIMMGLGIALYEEGDFDPKSGILLNSDIHQYRIPSSLETPDIQTFTVEADDVHYPYSGKPVGEAPLMGVLPAVRNAIFHATGIKVNELPISSAKILELEAN